MFSEIWCLSASLEIVHHWISRKTWCRRLRAELRNAFLSEGHSKDGGILDVVARVAIEHRATLFGYTCISIGILGSAPPQCNTTATRCTARVLCPLLVSGLPLQLRAPLIEATRAAELRNYVARTTYLKHVTFMSKNNLYKFKMGEQII